MDKPKLPKNAATDKPKQREARLDYIFHLIAEGCTVYSACKQSGITRKTFYLWINKDPDLMARYEEAQIELHDQVAEVIKLCALKSLTDHRYQTSAIFFAKARMGWNDGSGFVTGAQEMPSINFTKDPKVTP